MTTETLMTEGQSTQAADQQQNGASQPEGQTAAPGEQATQQTTQGQGADGQQAEGAKSNDEQGKPQGAPEQYEFKAPEGQQFDGTVLTAFSDVAKKLDLSQDKAQEVLDTMGPVIQARQAELIAQARESWANSTKADKEFGGDKLDENLATAKKAMDTFGTPELKTLLNESGLGNHPEVIRAFYRAGKAISEDRFVPGQGGKAGQGGAQRLYSASNMNP